MSAKKQTKADMWREFGLERPSSPRYEGLKGIYWRIFSEKRRKEDFEKYGTCISCGKRVNSWQDFDPGHFIPAGGGGFALLFHPQNVNGECKRCNAFDEMHLFGYAEGLDERYGPGTAERLKEMYNDAHFKGKITKEWGQVEYRARIAELLNTRN